jgi:hypothetical protein
MKLKEAFKSGVLLGVLLLFTASVVKAERWGTYHWGRTQNPFVLTLGKNVGRAWETALDNAARNWSMSVMFDMVVTTGKTTAAQCAINPGRIEVCNAKYGATGWYGLTQVTSNGDVITGASVKLNDSYKQTNEYKNMIACHEIGHSLGLWHQDETFGNPNINTCLDFTNQPLSNQQPNSKDYWELEGIYTPLDLFSTFASTGSGTGAAEVDVKSPRNWGKMVHAKANGMVVFERDLGQGRKLMTEAIMVPGEFLGDENPNPTRDDN